MDSDPFHAGERQLQSLFGVREQLAGSRAVQASLPPGFAGFLAELHYVVLAVPDREGRIWVTMVFGRPGFLSAPDAMHVHVAARPDAADPVARGIVEGASIAILAIDLSTRRRIRVNGSIGRVGQGDFVVDVRQAFGNCPQYIRPRDLEQAVGAGGEPLLISADTTVARRIVAGADTFFVATRAASDAGGDLDVSHRGGPAGFVRWDGDCLIWPEYRGNSYFNTLGNLLLDPACCLLFPDFGTGEMVVMTGHAVLDGFDGRLRRSHEGMPMNGLVRFKPELLMSRAALLRP
jgi:hypothetical protein